MGKQKGRRVPDKLISGSRPRLLNIPDEARGALFDLMVGVEQMARAGFENEGRGFLFWVNFPERDIDPAVKYCSVTSTEYRDFTRERDLVRSVQTYDPATQFVILEGEFDDPRGALRDVQISIMGFHYIDPTLAA